MTYEETFFDSTKDNFPEYCAHIQNELQGRNIEYNKIIRKIAKIIDENPKIREMVEEQKSSELSYEECKELVELMELQKFQKDIEFLAMFFKGGKEMLSYLIRIDSIKG